jgi:hypothetical protein
VTRPPAHTPSSWTLPKHMERQAMERRQQEVLAEVLLETGEAAPNRTVGLGSSGEQKARGVPIMGYGQGAILGSRPDDAVATRNLDRLLGRAA